jgi:tRNA-Thr(GGU) m(6)t(6)A37 methyltransferase TsaA
MSHAPAVLPAISVPIIGYHRSPLSQKFGIPRQPNLVEVHSYIEMLAPYNTLDAFVGIEEFSHLWLTWHTHHNRAQTNFKPQVRPPRLGGNAKLGVFATRSTYRPSQMGLSVVQLVGVEQTDRGVILKIAGADMVDGTPIVDIKPYVAYSDAMVNAVSGFAPDKPSSKTVKISETAQQQFAQLIETANDKNSLSSLMNKTYSSKFNTTFTLEDIDIIAQLIAQDPRPAYRQQETDNVFVMRYKQWDVSFQMDNSEVIWIVAVVAVV